MPNPHCDTHEQFEYDCIDCTDAASDHDPTPWCSGCGAMRKADCDCGPIAENE